MNHDLRLDNKGLYFIEYDKTSRPPVQLNNYVLSFKNSFFGIINDKKNVQNWVDIENEYYALLKDCLKEQKKRKYKTDVVTLNKEFEQVKNLLEEYLTTEIDKKFDTNDCQHGGNLLKHFLVKPRHLSDDHDNSYLKEFPKEDHEELIEFDNSIKKLHSVELQKYIKDNNLERNLFLNFNYTQSLDYYINFLWNGSWRNSFGYSKQIQIHGRLNDKDNPINFGFGDEMDDHYKLIENKDDNEYLKNIKSFQYLQNSNYKDLLDFIDSEKFQVYVMGHSCGLSDRILLNTIFEHEHCRSIKVFYHEFNEPKPDGRTDNYTDIVQNISRHFNKKKMMRDKIVNKSLCQPLPQDIRFAPK